MTPRNLSFSQSIKDDKKKNAKLKLRSKLKKLGSPSSHPINYSLLTHGNQQSFDNDHIQQIKYALLNLDTDSLKDINDTQNSI
jgi:hypothetical protein